jgi:protocatechuate 3,4-dioxygenase beta subunit
VFASNGIQTARTAWDGTYRLEHVPSGAVRLTALHRDHLTAKQTATVSAGAFAQVDFALGTGATIVGTVRDENGVLIADEKIMATQPMGGGTRQATTGSDGAYALRGFSPGTYMVMRMPSTRKGAGSEGGDKSFSMPEMRTVTVTGDETARVDFGGTVTGAALFGTVRTTAEEALGMVQIVKADKGIDGLQMTKIEDDGAYRFEGLAPGAYDLVVPPAHRQRVNIPEGATEVRADIEVPQGTISGRVLALDGAPLEGARVVAVKLTDQDDPLWKSLRVTADTDSEGRFLLEGIGPFRYEVVATKKGYAEAHAEVSLEGGAAADLVLRLSSGGSIRARILDPQGMPVAGVFLCAQSPDGTLHGLDMDGSSWFNDTTPTVESLPDGTYTVWALSNAYAFDMRSGVEVIAGEVTEVELGLSPGGRLELLCTDVTGTPLEGASLELALPGGTTVPQTFFDTAFETGASHQNGILFRKHLKAGTYEVRVHTKDGLTGTATAVIKDHETTQVTVALTPGG